MRCRLAGSSSWAGRVFENKKVGGGSRGAEASDRGSLPRCSPHAGAHARADPASDRPYRDRRTRGSVAFGYDSRSYAEPDQDAD
jgi:hypothetical protein